MITVHVKLFGKLRQFFPDIPLGDSMPVEVPANCTIAQLSEQLKLPPGKLAMVNGIAQPPTFTLSNDDQLALTPPIGGG